MDTATNDTATPAAATRATPRWPTSVRVLLALLAMVVAALSPVLFQLPLLAVPGAGDWLNDPANAAVAVPFAVVVRAVPMVVAVLLVWWLITKVDGRTLRDAGLVWTGRSLRLLGVGVLVCAVAMFAAALLLQGTAREGAELGSPLWAGIVLAVASAVLLQGFPEELIWRGYVMQTQREHPLRAVVVSSLVFGALHIVSAGGQETFGERIVYVGQAAAFGFSAAALVLLTRSLWSAVGVHAGFHLAAMTLSLFGLSVNSPAIWATNGVFHVMIGTAALVMWHRHGDSRHIVIDR